MNNYIKNLTVNEIQDLIERTVSKAIKENADKGSEFLTRKEVCKILKISGPTLSFYTKLGVIPYYKVGARIRYKRSEIMKLDSPAYSMHSKSKK